MRRVLRHIEQHKAELARSPFLTFLGDASVEPRLRFGFAPCMAPFVMGFADLNKYVLRDEASEDPIQRLINTHTREDDHHWGMFLRDLRTLELNAPMDFTGALEQLWGAHNQKARQLIYGLVALVSAESPVMRLVIVESVEAAGSVGFSRFTQVARELEAKTGKRLLYFGEAHEGLETGHLMGSGNVEETIAGLELTAEQVERARGLTDRTFALFHAMGEELLAHARRGLEGARPEPALRRGA
ncbi:hypothetical protein ATI61_106366 [Archangium gephyra]|uniref:Uncharacterized protein n=1 Tax=Archangium gephyra TaxID=48 RepID=A0AAC8Q115_9BACT|nr:hypothetical protein [Archangium gephyra]AKI98987.1 Hypothetical protein AA314_00614 [Archangium gephyra]REG30896.1 hypothetical protein ATI61_106366 [Archangium gephyra]